MSAPTSDVTGLGMTFGTFDEGRAWVGHRTEPRRAWFPIDGSMVLYYCSLVEDANPSYWEGEDCPPGLLMTNVMNLGRSLDGARFFLNIHSMTGLTVLFSNPSMNR